MHKPSRCTGGTGRSHIKKPILSGNGRAQFTSNPARCSIPHDAVRHYQDDHLGRLDIPDPMTDTDIARNRATPFTPVMVYPWYHRFSPACTPDILGSDSTQVNGSALVSGLLPARRTTTPPVSGIERDGDGIVVAPRHITPSNAQITILQGSRHGRALHWSSSAWMIQRRTICLSSCSSPSLFHHGLPFRHGLPFHCGLPLHRGLPDHPVRPGASPPVEPSRASRRLILACPVGHFPSLHEFSGSARADPVRGRGPEPASIGTNTPDRSGSVPLDRFPLFRRSKGQYGTCRDRHNTDRSFHRANRKRMVRPLT